MRGFIRFAMIPIQAFAGLLVIMACFFLYATLTIGTMGIETSGKVISSSASAWGMHDVTIEYTTAEGQTRTLRQVVWDEAQVGGEVVIEYDEDSVAAQVKGAPGNYLSVVILAVGIVSFGGAWWIRRRLS